jgi:hypothetical protein
MVILNTDLNAASEDRWKSHIHIIFLAIFK